MKITFVTDTYFPQANGVATTLEQLAKGLRDRGHEIDIIRLAFLACEEAGLKVPSVGLPGYKDVRFGFPIKLVLQTRYYKKRPDVIYVATETPLGASAVSAARALGIPAASGFHANFQQYVAHYQLPLLEKVTLKYPRHVHNRSSCTFVPSQNWSSEVLKILSSCLRASTRSFSLPGSDPISCDGSGALVKEMSLASL